MIHSRNVESVREPAIARGVERFKVRRVKRQMVHEAGESEPAGDRQVEVGKAVVVKFEERQQRTVAGVVEYMAEP